jgi:hypothetical protein
MVSLRLPIKIEKQLNEISENEHLSKSAIIKDALNMFFNDYYQKTTPYDLGKDLFGKYGSKKGNLSVDYKKLIKGKLHEKFSH